MRKSVTAAIITAMFISVAAEAAPTTGFYFGGDYLFNEIQYHDTINYPKNLTGGDLYAGWRVSKWFGVEASYELTSASNKIASGTTTTTYRTSLTGPSFDVYFYLPFGDSGFSLFATTGGAVLHASIKNSASVYDATAKSYTQTDTTVFNSGTGGLRYGGGIEWEFIHDFSLRITARAQPLWAKNHLSNALTLGAGLNFHIN